MVNNKFLKNLPDEFSDSMRTIRRRLLRKYNDISAIILIGSLVDGSFTNESDIDLVCIKRRRIKWDDREKIIKNIEKRVQIIVFTQKALKELFMQSTTMAHAIKRGVVLYQNTSALDKILLKKLSLPSRKWMKEWFEHWLKHYRYGLRDLRRWRKWHYKYCKQSRCQCFLMDNLARAMVNFSILYVETKGIVPTTKVQLRVAFRKIFKSKKLNKALRTSLHAYKNEGISPLANAELIRYAAGYIKQKLNSSIFTQPCLQELGE